MADQLDAARFPHAASYVAGLPAGWESFPDCLAHTDTFDLVRRTHPELGALGGVPEVLRKVVRGEDAREWIPEVIGCALFLVARDALFANDEDFLKWCAESARNSFSRPWARILMALLSPTLVVMGSAKRWNAFHRGTTLTPAPAVREHGRMIVRATLTYPAGLFTPLTLRRWGVAYEMALTMARASAPRVALVSPAPTTVDYSVSWDL